MDHFLERLKNGNVPDSNIELSVQTKLADSLFSLGSGSSLVVTSKQKFTHTLSALVDCSGQMSRAAFRDCTIGDSTSGKCNRTGLNTTKR